MKKILFIAVFVTAFFAANSQNRSGNTSSREMSVEEANRLNGTVEPTINGIPYSQYKAQQDLLKQQQQAASKQAIISPMRPTPQVPKPVQDTKTKSDEHDLRPFIVNNPAETKPAADKITTTVTKTEVPEQFKLPATQAFNGTPATDKTKPEVITQQPKLPEIILVKETPATKNNPANATTQPDNKQSSPASTPVSSKKEN